MLYLVTFTGSESMCLSEISHCNLHDRLSPGKYVSLPAGSIAVKEAD